MSLKMKFENFKTKLLKYNLPKGHPVVILWTQTNFYCMTVACMSLVSPYIPVDTIYFTTREIK